jgi:hypothetical protein
MILNNFLGVTPIEKIGVGLPFPLPDEKSGELLPKVMGNNSLGILHSETLVLKRNEETLRTDFF